ncbi:Fur family transcriptional regulator [Phycisphaerales bacterium AB-hyl4]|uniref:Fur family transcriptional regulator n=1 Tax=Natronomicrosphaera hydrolytica TaxID=3242702 RepID=A0ABV4U2Q0_9BACT
MERRTPQREAIREAIQQADRPLGPQEILERALHAVPGLGMATVYRTVRAGVDEGWLQPVDLPGSPTRYEPAGKQHHHHFACRTCGGVFEVDGCPGNLGALTPDGFKLENHEVVLYGLCRQCND